MRGTALLALLAIAIAAAGCIGTQTSDEEATPPADETNSSDPSEAAEGDGAVSTFGGDEGASIGSGGDVETWWLRPGFEGAEPSMTSTSGGLFVTSTGDLTLRSRDGGRTWEPVHEYLTVQGQQILSSGDPFVASDPVTERVYTLHMYPRTVCNSLFVSEDEGASWDHRPLACGTPSTDHPKLAAGPPPGDANPLADQAESVLYLCYNKLAATACAVSYDGGTTWPVDRDAIGANDGCGGINGPVTVGPEGVAVLAATLGCEAPVLAVSTDGGLTWETHRVPADVGAVSQDPATAFDAAGNLYLLWRGDDQRLHLARSPDLGASWAGPWSASAPDVTSTVFQVLEAGDPGRIALATIGTDETDERSRMAAEGVAWHLRIVASTDAHTEEPTFTSYQVTPPSDPVQVGCIDDGREGDLDSERYCRNLLDFIGSTVTEDGRFRVAYADGCVEACRGGDPPGQSSEARLAIAGLEGFPLQAG